MTVASCAPLSSIWPCSRARAAPSARTRRARRHMTGDKEKRVFHIRPSRRRACALAHLELDDALLLRGLERAHERLVVLLDLLVVKEHAVLHCPDAVLVAAPDAHDVGPQRLDLLIDLSEEHDANVTKQERARTCESVRERPSKSA